MHLKHLSFLIRLHIWFSFFCVCVQQRHFSCRKTYTNTFSFSFRWNLFFLRILCRTITRPYHKWTDICWSDWKCNCKNNSAHNNFQWHIVSILLAMLQLEGIRVYVTLSLAVSWLNSITTHCNCRWEYSVWWSSIVEHHVIVIFIHCIFGHLNGEKFCILFGTCSRLEQCSVGTCKRLNYNQHLIFIFVNANEWFHCSTVAAIVSHSYMFNHLIFPLKCAEHTTNNIMSKS